MNEVFVIPRDAQAAIPNDVGDDSYILIMKPGYNPLKVLAKDLALTRKFTISSTAPASPKVYDRWINDNLEESIYFNGEWRSLGIKDAVHISPQDLTEAEKIVARSNIGVNRVWMGLTDPELSNPTLIMDGDSWVYTGVPSLKYERVSGSWVLIAGSGNEAITGFVPFSEQITELTNGGLSMELSHVPYDKKTTVLYINGLSRDEFTLVGKVITLPYVPSPGSVIMVSYFRLLNVVEPEPIAERVDSLWEFMQVFIHTNKILTTDEGVLLLSETGEFIEVDIL